MKKIMFNDKCQLTKAVLEGRKTMTRRLVKSDNIVSITTSDGAVHHVDKTFGSYHEYMDKDGKVWLAWSPYKVGEIVAVAQRYVDIYLPTSGVQRVYNESLDLYEDALAYSQGWNNKMFVRADLMPHHIRITDIKMERLKDISIVDCLKEGVYMHGIKLLCLYRYPGQKKSFEDPKEAFAALIDKVSGKGTWESNPWVFAYSFELID